MDVREVMTPRVDVVALSIPVHTEDVAQAVRESGHRSFPVVNGSLDDVVGVLYVSDLFRSRRSGRPGRLGGAAVARPGEALLAGAGGSLSSLDISRRIRPAYVIPESRHILDALVEMRHQRRGFAMVVDEYGGVSGVLTVKDLLEPIVGELHDETDTEEEPAIVRVDGSRWLIDGRVNVDEVRERLDIDVPEGDYVTLGGYLFDGFGRIPEEGETLAVDGWDLTVQEMDKRRVAQVVARKRPAEESAGAEGGTPSTNAGEPPGRDAASSPLRPAAEVATGTPGTDSQGTGNSTGPEEPHEGSNGDGPRREATADGLAGAGLGAARVQAEASSPSGAARRRG